MGKFKDLTGQRFGKLTVIERTTDYIYPSGTKGVRWKCQCDCGKIVEIMTQPLKDGQTKSCGCSKGEFISLAVSDNLIGKKFNHLTVIQRNGYIVHNDRTTLQWLCKCDCGNQVSATAYQLKNDIIKSCGCLTDNIHHKKCCDDISGQKFNRLTVIKKDETKKTLHWLCQCECGNITSVRTYHLKNGIVKSCGCLCKEINSKRCIKDLTGQRFGRLIVVQRAEDYIIPKSGKHHVRWLCRCDCGNECVVTGGNLKSGVTHSCGCYKKEQMSEYFTKDITGQKFGKLTAIEKVENKWGKLHWRCLCDCGNEIVVASNSLVSHKTTSCGCILSYGEYQVSQYLLQHNVKFESQKKFDNLIGVGNGKLSYDFYLPQHNLLIECQGKQHQSPIELFGGTEQFKIQQEHDRRKKDYAKFHGYELLEVWYYDYNNIENILNDKIKNIS